MSRASIAILLACLAACAGNVSGAAGGAGADPDGAGALGDVENTAQQPGAGESAAQASITPCEGDGPGAPQIRRLAHFEYANSVQDLLGIESDAASRFAADTVVHGYDNNAGALTVTPLLADQLAAEAERVAALAVADLGRLLPCEPGQGEPCAERFVRELGLRAFRRPPTDAEVARYLELFRLGDDEAGFASGIELVLSALLQSPNFLYRTEIGDGSQGAGEGVTLTGHEIATQLAYALTGSTPDAELLDAAESGTLLDAAGRRAQAERLLQTPRGREQAARFVRRWLELDRLASVPKDAELFPEFDGEVRASLAREVDAFVAGVVFDAGSDATLPTLLTAPHGYVDGVLARFHGLTPPADAARLERVERPDPQRAGLLTLGAVMATHARPDGSSPVHRGKLIRERVLCQPLQPPPPGVVVEPPPVDPTLSVRERYAAHSEEPACQGCHRMIDPVGLSLEHFDGVGRYREREGEHDIDASGELLAIDGTDVRFDGAVELAALLAESEEVRDCFALQYFRFAFGAEDSAALQCTAEQLRSAFEAEGGDIRALMLAGVEPRHVVERQPWQTPPSGEVADDTPIVEPPPADDGSMPAPSGGGTTPGLDVQTRTDSSWATGRCDAVTVTNVGDGSVAWEVSLSIDGTLTNHWNAVASGDSGEVTFRGVDWNAQLEPGASAEFGYCLER